MEIIDEMALCLVTLWKKLRRRPLVIGHSAGGHLSAAMLANEWGRVAGVPADLVRAGYGLSGVYDLAPLIGTSLNQALYLSAGISRAASPMFRPAPAKGRRFVAAVGGDESAEFLRQSREIAQTWEQAGVVTENVVVPGANHFTILEELIRARQPRADAHHRAGARGRRRMSVLILAPHVWARVEHRARESASGAAAPRPRSPSAPSRSARPPARGPERA